MHVCSKSRDRRADDTTGGLGLELEHEPHAPIAVSDTRDALRGQIVVSRILERGTVCMSKVDVAKGDAVVAVDDRMVDASVHSAREVESWLQGRCVCMHSAVGVAVTLCIMNLARMLIGVTKCMYVYRYLYM